MAVIQDDEFDLLKLMEQSPDEMMFGGVQPVVSNVASVDDVKNLSSYAVEVKRDNKGGGTATITVGAGFDKSGLCEYLGCEGIRLFVNFDMLRFTGSGGIELDGGVLSSLNQGLGGISRMTASIEAYVPSGCSLKVEGLRGVDHVETRLGSYVGFTKGEDYDFYPLSWADCDILNPIGDTGVLEDVIAERDVDVEAQLLDSVGLHLARGYQEHFVRAACVCVERLFTVNCCRGYGLASWLLGTLPVIVQASYSMLVGDILLIPGDFSSEASKRGVTPKEYLSWLEGYYEHCGFNLMDVSKLKGLFVSGVGRVFRRRFLLY